MKIVSLFANIGVAEAYLKEMGIDVVVANELLKDRAELYQKIYPETQMICGDISTKEIYDTIRQVCKKKRVDLIMATPPCQGMSTAGKKDGGDKRNRLFLYALELIKDLKPKYFMFENVTAFLSTSIEIDGTWTLIPDVIRKEVEAEYDISFNVIDAKDYGVPQTRSRVIILASRKNVNKKWVMPPKEEKVVTMQDAIGWLPIIDPFVRDLPKEEFDQLFPLYEERKAKALSISQWNIPTSHVYRQVRVMQHTPTGQSAFKNIDQFLPRKKNGQIVKGFKNTYKRQNWDSPAYTIAMDNIEISSQNNVHPGRLVGKDSDGYDIYSDARALTIYELMKLMTLPDNWNLPDDTDKHLLRRVIGEGIPSLLVQKIYMKLVK